MYCEGSRDGRPFLQAVVVRRGPPEVRRRTRRHERHAVRLVPRDDTGLLVDRHAEHLAVHRDRAIALVMLSVGTDDNSTGRTFGLP